MRIRGNVWRDEERGRGSACEHEAVCCEMEKEKVVVRENKRECVERWRRRDSA